MYVVLPYFTTSYPAGDGYAIISESMGKKIYHHHSLSSADKAKSTKMHSILTVSPHEDGNRYDEDHSQPYPLWESVSSEGVRWTWDVDNNSQLNHHNILFNIDKEGTDWKNIPCTNSVSFNVAGTINGANSQTYNCKAHVRLTMEICPTMVNPTKAQCVRCTRGNVNNKIDVTLVKKYPTPSNHMERSTTMACANWFTFASTVIQAKASLWQVNEASHIDGMQPTVDMTDEQADSKVRNTMVRLGAAATAGSTTKPASKVKKQLQESATLPFDAVSASHPDSTINSNYYSQSDLLTVEE